MDKLVSKYMLELARIDAGGLEFKRASVNVNQLASGIAEEFQLPGQAAELSLSSKIRRRGPPEIQADQFQLQQVLRNLGLVTHKVTPKKVSILAIPCRPARMASHYCEGQWLRYPQDPFTVHFRALLSLL